MHSYTETLAPSNTSKVDELSDSRFSRGPIAPSPTAGMVPAYNLDTIDEESETLVPHPQGGTVEFKSTPRPQLTEQQQIDKCKQLLSKLSANSPVKMSESSSADMKQSIDKMNFHGSVFTPEHIGIIKSLLYEYRDICKADHIYGSGTIPDLYMTIDADDKTAKPP